MTTLALLSLYANSFITFYLLQFPHYLPLFYSKNIDSSHTVILNLISKTRAWYWAQEEC